jgi:hypothetical protein
VAPISRPASSREGGPTGGPVIRYVNGVGNEVAQKLRSQTSGSRWIDAARFFGLVLMRRAWAGAAAIATDGKREQALAALFSIALVRMMQAKLFQ